MSRQKGNAGMENARYRWSIRHPELGSVEVEGQDKLHALYEAARRWHVRWTLIARQCEFERLGICDG